MGVLLTSVVGCAGSSPKFETIDAPPLAQESGDLEEVAAPSLDLAPSARPYEETLQTLFLALNHSDQLVLSELLTQDALLRRGSSASSDSALSELLQLSSGGQSENPDVKLVPVSRYAILEVSPENSPPTAIVDVFGEEPVAGAWHIRFALGSNPRITEIVLPASK